MIAARRIAPASVRASLVAAIDVDDASLADMHEGEGLALRAGLTLPGEDDPRLDAWERAALAVLIERSVGRTALVTLSELVLRLAGRAAGDLSARREMGGGWFDDVAVADAVDRLVKRRLLGRCAGGGFVILWRAC